MSRICEEFHCLPSEALRELEEGPLGLALDIIWLRAYAEAKQRIDAATSEDDVPRTPLTDMVFQIQAELIREKRDGRGAA